MLTQTTEVWRKELLEEGRRETLVLLLDARFDPDQWADEIEWLDAQQLAELTRFAACAQEVDEIRLWLEEQRQRS